MALLPSNPLHARSSSSGGLEGGPQPQGTLAKALGGLGREEVKEGRSLAEAAPVMLWSSVMLHEWRGCDLEVPRQLCPVLLPWKGRSSLPPW